MVYTIRFTVNNDNSKSEINYLLDIIRKEELDNKTSVVAEIYNPGEPFAWLLTYLNKPGLIEEDYDVDVLRHEYVRLVPLYLFHSKTSQELIKDPIKFDYEKVRNRIRTELLDSTFTFEDVYRKKASSILFVTLYNCTGTYNDFRILSKYVANDLRNFFPARTKLYIVGATPKFYSNN
jgi:hypothetical protein